jgi:hypothetical protein
MFHTREINVTDEWFKDNIKTSDYHFNALRQRPQYPGTFIDLNLTQLKQFPDKWKSHNEPDNVSNRGRPHLAKRCMFYDTSSGQHVHLNSLDTIGMQHLLDTEPSGTQSDYLLDILGFKKKVYDKRNDLCEVSPGDKPYKTVEYSQEFFNKINRNWRSEKYNGAKRYYGNEISDEDLIKFKLLLDLDPNDSLFKYRKDLNYEHDVHKEYLNEIDNVKNLDNWKPASKLDVPFKVLDVVDKNHKYRPKVTK